MRVHESWQSNDSQSCDSHQLLRSFDQGLRLSNLHACMAALIFLFWPLWFITLSQLTYSFLLESSPMTTISRQICGFLSPLLLLFNVCPHCKVPNPLVEARQFGTTAHVTTTCHNEKCKKTQNIWKSQPTMTGTMIPAGNFLLSFAILIVGGSASKVIKIFETMGLACISLSTFFRHQRVYSDLLWFCTIVLRSFWKGLNL